MCASRNSLLVLLATFPVLIPQAGAGEERPMRYRPDGDEIVIENGENRFNRPLYGSNTAFYTHSGDLPEIMLSLPGKGGTLWLGIVAGETSKWLSAAEHVVARYRAGAYTNDDGELALENFRKARKTSLAWLEKIRPSDWKRRGIHHVAGEVELSQILSLWAFHDLSHIRQVAELVKAISFWDSIGSLQVYYSVQP